jgi:hypothetical protein
MSSVSQFFYDYQTIIAGALALSAALYANRHMSAQVAAQRDQLEHERHLAKRDRAGRLRAARASLPAALSDICRYAAEAGKVLYAAWPLPARMYAADAAGEGFRIWADVPRFPAAALCSLERVIELTDDEAVADRLESILREAQVLDARTSGMSKPANMVLDTLSVFILQAAAVHARAESLLDYSRGELPSLSEEPLWVRTRAALTIFGIHNDAIIQMAARQEARDLPPGSGDRRSSHPLTD